jgi:hypothetical protein
MGNVESLVSLLKERNQIDRRITQIIQRPAEKGHIAEWIASKIFPIELNNESNKEGYDGVFTDGELKGKKVDVKFYAANEHIIDLNPNIKEEIYLLVFTGPYRAAGSSKNKERPFCIKNVYLFNELELCNSLKENGIKLSVATSVRKEYWEKSQVYPKDNLGFNLGMKSNLIKLFSRLAD